MAKITKKDIKAMGDRYLTSVERPGCHGVWLRITQIKFAKWFSVPKYGSLAKAKRAAKQERDAMLLSGDYGIELNKPKHHRSDEDKLPPKLTRNNPDLFALLDLAEKAEDLGIMTMCQLKSLIKVSMLEGMSAVDMNNGESKNIDYSQLNASISLLGQGKKSRPGRKLLYKGEPGQATGGAASVSGEWHRRPVLLTDKGLEGVNQLLDSIGGDKITPFTLK